MKMLNEDTPVESSNEESILRDARGHDIDPIKGKWTVDNIFQG